MKTKSIRDMTAAEYQKLVRECEKRYPANKLLNELPYMRPAGRRAATPNPREPLTVRSVKLTAREWQALRQRARSQRMSVSALIRAFAQEHSVAGA